MVSIPITKLFRADARLGLRCPWCFQRGVLTLTAEDAATNVATYKSRVCGKGHGRPLRVAPLLALDDGEEDEDDAATP